MKNVAATSGQSVSLAALFFAVGMAREGSWAGSDMELNFYSRPPKGNSLSPLRQNEFAFAEYKSRFCMQGKNALNAKYLQFRQPCFRPAPALVRELLAPAPRCLHRAVYQHSVC
jgi:hypothetical protein